MTQALRDQMVELIPGLRWTHHTTGAATARFGGLFIARVWQSQTSRHIVTHVSLGGGTLRYQSPAHAAKTIRRKLREFRNLFDKALAVEETTP